MDNAQAALLKETEDQVITAVDLWQRSKQLVALKRLRMITNMEGQCENLDYEIRKAMKAEAARGG